MSNIEFKRQAVEFYLDAIGLTAGVLDGHDNAILGVAGAVSNQVSVVYSKRQIIKNFLRDGMTWEDALEYFDYNVEPVADMIQAIVVDDMIFEEAQSCMQYEVVDRQKVHEQEFKIRAEKTE